LIKVLLSAVMAVHPIIIVELYLVDLYCSRYGHVCNRFYISSTDLTATFFLLTTFLKILLGQVCPSCLPGVQFLNHTVLCYWYRSVTNFNSKSPVPKTPVNELQIYLSYLYMYFGD